MEEVGCTMLSTKGFGDELPQGAEMRAAFAADIEVVALQKLHEHFGHYIIVQIYINDHSMK
jgi:predicted RNA-binding protein with PUA domain